MVVLTSIVFIFSFLCTVAFILIKRRHGYWAKKKVPYLKPDSLLFGSSYQVFFNKMPMYLFHAKLYNELAPHRYAGYFSTLTPALVVRDPETIKTILTKDFSYFTDRNSSFTDDDNPVSSHLFNLGGQLWRILRIKLMPTFSSGKIKIMFNLMKECTEELVNAINRTIDKREEQEIREMMARYTTDVISSCVFGLQSNSQKDVGSVFREMGRKVFAPSRRAQIIGLVSAISPRLRRLLGLTFVDKEVAQFFKSTVTSTIKYREENNVKRNDFLDLLISLKKEETLSVRSKEEDEEDIKIEFTDNLLTAQCFVFFVAGFETSSGTLNFALYELARHKEIQNTLFMEISKTIEENENELSYECLQKMTYLDKVISETLRMYPLLPMLSRTCNSQYQFDDGTVIEKGTRVTIPVLGLHHDPQYFENPEKFDPENFSQEAKSRRHHYAYLPFGEGPRICIGMRFGLMQVKLGLASIIRNFSVSVSPKMNKHPLEFSTMSFLPVVKDGVWLIFEKRVK